MSGHQKWTDAECAEMHRLHKSSDDMTWRDVGERFDTTEASARRAVQRWKRRTDREERAKQAAYSKVAERKRLEAMFPDWEQPEQVSWREWLASAEDRLELIKRADPQQQVVTMDLSDVDRPVAIAFSGDWHVGGGWTSHKKLRQMLEYVYTTDDLKLAMVGDSIEGFIPGMKSAETSEQMAQGLKEQLAFVKDIAEDFAEARKWVCWLWGDHDAKWFENAIGINLIKTEVHDKLPYFNGRGIVKLKLGEEEYFIQVSHSYRFASQWNPNHPQRRGYERFFPADVTVSGHKHNPAVQCITHYEQLREAGINLGGRAWFVQTGTFKTGEDPYTVRSWTKGVAGVPTAVFRPDTHDVDVFWSPEKAMAYIDALRRREAA